MSTDAVTPAVEVVAPVEIPAAPPKRSLFRINYYLGGQVKTAFVVAYTAPEATDFLGVRDGSAQAYVTAGNVEVVGLDKAHEAIAALPVTHAESSPAPQLSADELAKLRKFISAL